MITAHKLLAGVFALALMALGGGYALFAYNQQVYGAGASIGHYESNVWQFGQGLYAGLTQQLSIDANGALTQTATTTEGSLACKTFSSSYADATTTLAAFPNPFGATSTAVFTNTEITTAATSSLSLEIGTTTANTMAPTDNTKISGSLATVTVSSSTLATITAGVGATGIPVGGTSSGGVAMIQLAPNDVFAIYATNTNANADNGGILGRNNAFAGTYNVRICR